MRQVISSSIAVVLLAGCGSSLGQSPANITTAEGNLLVLGSELVTSFPMGCTPSQAFGDTQPCLQAEEGHQILVVTLAPEGGSFSEEMRESLLFSELTKEGIEAEGGTYILQEDGTQAPLQGVGLWDGSVFSLIGGGVFSLQRENPLGEDENALYAIFGVKISATQFELHWGQNPTISLEPSSG